MSFEAHIRRALHQLETASLLRKPRVHEATQSAELVLRDLSGPGHSRVVNLCSNNYLGLADHPALVRAAAAALAEHGLGAGGSRLITGTHALHRSAEQRLAAFVQRPSALLFSTGYAANVGTVQALASRGDVIFSDALNHASLIDGARLSRAQVHVYRHADPEHLAELLAAHRGGYGGALVITESLFSMDGDTAPLPALRALCDRHGAGLMVDEAHALGVWGPQGRGLCAEHAVVPDVLVGTLGKAFGASGAFAAGSAELTTLLQNRARSYVFSTAAPPALAAAAIAACDLVEEADDLRERLRALTARLRVDLLSYGYRVPSAPGPILAALVGEPEAAMELSRALLARGVFVQGIRPPTVPAGTSRLRITPIATHSDAQLEQASAAFAAVSPLIAMLPP